MARKVYQVIGYLNQTIQLTVGGTKTRIEFRGGSRHPKVKQGQFVTSDKEVQNALEDGALFNVSYKLIKIDNKRTEEEEVVLSPEARITLLTELNANLEVAVEKLEKKLAKAGDPEILKDKEAEIAAYKVQVKELKGIIEKNEKASKKQEKKEEVKEDDPIVYTDVINMQQARDILVSKHGQDISKLPNGASVKNKAKDLAIQFPNWK